MVGEIFEFCTLLNALSLSKSVMKSLIEKQRVGQIKKSLLWGRTENGEREVHLDLFAVQCNPRFDYGLGSQYVSSLRPLTFSWPSWVSSDVTNGSPLYFFSAAIQIVEVSERDYYHTVSKEVV